jgi:uncharacterized protein (DUF1697 family)
MERTTDATVLQSKTNEKIAENRPVEEKSDKINVLDVDVTDENVALNILVTFVNIAQKRGAFNLAESAKIWDCIKMFQYSQTARDDQIARDAQTDQSTKSTKTAKSAPSSQSASS